ncbi:kinase [Aliarcobacter trophiarum LMG 25534]|uniref:Kinase n=1 Tax=Aliarcobacter trophiarum LMG 25534 TaxID=1032241 RepID=A0AAD0QIA5_9BACT|nr:kinase [Aliarcobacter trophiarum]AXK48387.1 hypothetical protein ATR_0506 [Aliarcobacter trophiarum LMG 25534]RXJ92943.1 kinase [Aliarcobacter trophiarum LMG 25534]
MSSLENISKKEFLNSKKEISSFIFEDKQYWLKKARATKPDKLQDFFYKILPFELLIPPIKKDKKEALEFEISKLEEFFKFGINVPKIVYKNEEFFVLEDSGKTIYSILRDENIKEESFYFYVDLVLVELTKIHNLGFFHGGSQLRNFTYKEEKVFAIDFEESFLKNIDIKTLQYRDFLLFLLSFLKMKELKFKIDYERIIDKYIKFTNSVEFKKKLINFSKKLRFFLWLYKKEFIKKRVGSDVRYFFELIEILNKMGKNAE